MSAVSSIRNLGPASDEIFARAGIKTAEELRNLGADAAYAKLLKSGRKPHFIAYYSMVMGLQGRPWNDCKGDEKIALRARFDSIVQSTHSDIPPGIERALNEVGTGLRR